jgi:hypothetical protein
VISVSACIGGPTLFYEEIASFADEVDGAGDDGVLGGEGG